MGDLLELMNMQPAGGGVSGDGRSLQSGHLQSGDALRADDTGAAEAVQICQLFHQMEQQQLMGGGVGALPVDAAAMAASHPQRGSGPSSSSMYAQQAAGAGGVSIQRLPVQLVQATGGLPAVVPSHAPLPQQLLQQQAQHYLSATLPAMSTQSGAGGAHSGLYPAGSHSLLQAAPSITVATSGAVTAKDAAAAARAARQRKRKEMAAAAAEKAALEAAAAAGGGALLMLPTPSVQLATAPSEGEEGCPGAVGGAMAVGSGEVSFGGEAATLTAMDSGEAGSDERQQKRMIKNRESAARSRARRQEYTASLEQQVASLREQNRDLRVRVVLAAAAPADPHAGKLDGQLLRRTRTTPL